MENVIVTTLALMGISALFMIILALWSKIHRSLDHKGRSKSEAAGTWVIYAILGGVVLLGILYGNSSNDFSENLPHYLQ